MSMNLLCLYLMEKLVLENEHEIVLPLSDAAFAAPIKGTTILY